AMIETTLAQFTVQEPQPEQIVAQLLAEQPFAADAKEGDQHARLEQLLRRNAGTPLLGIERVEQRRELLQDGVHTAFNSSQGMIGRYTGIKVHHGQKVGLSLRFSTHVDPIPSSHYAFKQSSSFSTPC